MDDALRARILALRARYGVTLPRQVAEIAEAVAHWKVDPRDAARAAAVTSLAHRLCGTSGSYGYDDICDAAKTVEALVRVNIDAMDLLRIDDAMAQLLLAARRAAEGHT